ncbi:MAG: FUSC family protein, partial [Bradyrhizobium sp.]|nr:FUSC family protein [Bradyrhizobium sp.]
GIIRAFDRKVVALLPLVSAIEDRLTLLRRMGPLEPRLARAVDDVHDWVNAKVPADERRIAELKQACVEAIPKVGPQSSWEDLVTLNISVRLIELIDAWQAKLGFVDYLADPERAPGADVRAAAAEIGPKPMHTDPGIALLSALAACVAMGLCGFFWIATAWPEGAGAIAFAAVASTLFASLDDPTPTIRNISLILALCIPLVFVYQFFVLPAISGFVLLCIVLAFVLIPAGLLMANPAYAPVGLALALGFTVEMSLQTSYTADLAAIINSNSAFVLGGVAALIVTRLMRVIGTEASAQRLLRAIYRDLADLAGGRARPTREHWASRMMDRVALLLYRQPRFEPRPRHEFADALRDLRLGVNMIETQAMASSMPYPAQHALATMLAGLDAHFRSLARGRVAPLGDDLLQKIDIVVSEVAACAASTPASISAIVGLRQTLYPEAPAYQPRQADAAQMAPSEAASVGSVS